MYTTIFILLVLGGLGFPMPEEIPLLIAGIGCSQGKLSIELAFLICYVGVLVGDQTMYAFGYFFGNKLLNAGTRSPLLPAITKERVNDVREGLRKRRLMALFVGRHLFFLRSVTFVVAGALHVPFLEFLIADAAAAIVSVSVFMGLGYVLGESLSPEVVTHLAHQANLYLGLLVGVIGLGYIVYLRWTRARRSPEDPASKVVITPTTCPSNSETDRQHEA